MGKAVTSFITKKYGISVLSKLISALGVIRKL